MENTKKGVKFRDDFYSLVLNFAIWVTVVKNAKLKTREEKKNEGRLEGERPPSSLPPPPLRFPGVQFNSLPTDGCALLSERLEQATLMPLH